MWGAVCDVLCTTWDDGLSGWRALVVSANDVWVIRASRPIEKKLVVGKKDCKENEGGGRKAEAR